MAREEKEWHPRFVKYMEMIAAHPNYKGLSIEQKKDGSLKWIATAKSKVGKERIKWADNKAAELGLPKRVGVYADIMLTVHPTKWKVCQTCGESMSLYYHYPNVNFLKSLNKHFKSDFTNCDHISDIWDNLLKNGFPQIEIASFLIKKGNLDLNPAAASKEEIINALEYACRKGSKKCLGPGAMSNFPDRYDGFHTYNRCCRSLQDKGRSKENLKSYTQDRRAYEYWSDGNIYAANQFIGSGFFEGASADHIGPISLGFVHDPRYLQPMPSGDNSTKRDRLQITDIEHIIEIEAQTGIYPMSWQSKLIWEHIKENYISNPNKVATIYRDTLKQNMVNYMYILKAVLENCQNNGKAFLIKAFLEPHYKDFAYSYSFNEKGEITHKEPRHNTDRNRNELERYARIAIDSVYDYNEKDNRNNKHNLSSKELSKLNDLCQMIERNDDNAVNEIISLVEQIEKRMIATL